MDPLGKFRKFGRGGKDPEARSGHVESTVMFPMSKAGTPSLKPSVVTSCQAEDDAPDELGEVVGKGGVTGAVVDCMRHRLRSLLRGCCSSSEGTGITGATEEVASGASTIVARYLCISKKADIRTTSVYARLFQKAYRGESQKVQQVGFSGADKWTPRR